MSARAPRSNEGRPSRPALVIDGEAVVVSRKAPPRGAEPASGAAPGAKAATPFELHPHGTPRAAFGRRPSGRRLSAPDLVFQGVARHASEPEFPKAARRGLGVFTDAAGLGGARDRRMAGLAAILALLALPVLILSAPIAPAEATPGTGPLAGSPLVIDQLVTSIVPRGTGAVLTVEARIRNLSGQAASVPPVRIALAQPDGGLRSKSLVPGVSTLQAGRSVRFHSSVAVAKDTKGAIEVGFVSPAALSGKTLIE